jgi:putative endonuclease
MLKNILVKMYWVYVLKNSKNRTYTGHTGQLFSRVKKHKNGLSYWTSRFKEWRVVYYEKYKTRSEAMEREKELKSGKGRDELKKKGIL